MAQPVTERPAWHRGHRTTKLESPPCGRFLISKIGCFLGTWSLPVTKHGDTLAAFASDSRAAVVFIRAHLLSWTAFQQSRVHRFIETRARPQSLVAPSKAAPKRVTQCLKRDAALQQSARRFVVARLTLSQANHMM